jgi:hypothetical protein
MVQMNRLTTEAVAQIKACEGIYRPADLARAYGCHRGTVTRIWEGTRRSAVQANSEAPNVITRNRPSDLKQDIDILLDRGHTPEQVAAMLDISRASVFIYRGVFI